MMVANTQQIRGSQQVYPGMREILLADRTYYVRTDGNDSNTGLVNTAAGAFLTIQKAVDVVSSLDVNGYAITIQIADGTYTGAVTLKNVVGFASAGDLVIQGNNGTPANVLISVTGVGFTADGLFSVWDIKDLKLVTTSHCILSSSGSTIRFANLNFGTSGYHLVASGYGTILCIGNYTVSGGAGRHIWAETGSFIRLAPYTVTFTANMSFSVFCFEFNLGNVQANSCTFSIGAFTITGQRYNVQFNSVCYVGGAGVNFFPGSTAGATSTGGQYA